MKKNLLYTLLVGAGLFGFASCDVNDWNENHLDGFEGDPAIEDVQTLEYTLTTTDYSNLAANTTNKALATELGLADELAIVGKNAYFTDKVTAKDFVPAFLSDPDFAYFALSDGSAIKMTYNVAVGLPEEVLAINSAKSYKVTEENYMDVWGSDEDFIESFSPANKPAKFMSDFLTVEFPDAEEGDYVVAQYNNATQEPIFQTVTPEPEPTIPLGNKIASVSVDETLVTTGVVTGICAHGFILTDNSGSILAYFGSSYVLDNYEIGDVLKVNCAVSSYNKGLQLTATDDAFEKVGTMKYTYPTPIKYTGADFDNIITRTTDELGVYAQFDCTVSVSGNYYNFKIDGATTAQGSLYQGTEAQKAALVDGAKATICGYFLSISGGKYANFVVTSINGTTVNKKAARAKKAVAEVPSAVEYGLYKFNGTKWSEVTGVAVLNQADYRAMGQSYNNFSSAADADFYLQRYMNSKYPYAQLDDTQIACYNLYSNKVTSVCADQYKFNGSEWVKDNGVVAETAQFVRTGGKWMYDPNVTITLPAGKGQELSTLYYQACTDWVWENVDKAKLGVSTKGQGYVTSYGNNEYYCGTSAYQGNVDLRPAKALEQYPDGYTGMSEDEILQLMKDRFTKEVMPGALAMLHPDAAPVEGLEVIYTINFAVYTGSTAEYTVRYKVVGKGQFEFIDCTWDTAE